MYYFLCIIYLPSNIFNLKQFNIKICLQNIAESKRNIGGFITIRAIKKRIGLGISSLNLAVVKTVFIYSLFYKICVTSSCIS